MKSQTPLTRQAAPLPLECCSGDDADPKSVLEELRTYHEELWFQTQQLVETQVELESASEQLNEFFDRAPVAYLILDRLGVIQNANYTATQWLGREGKEKLLHRPLIVHLTRESHQIFLDHMRRCRSSPGTAVSSELALLQTTADPNRTVQVSTKVSATEDPPTRFFTVMSDMTELKAAQERSRMLEDQVVRAERLAAIGTLAAGIAHEIKNPISSIRMLAEYAQQVPDDVNRPDVLAQIMQQTDRCARIVDGILRFSRDEETPKEPRDINAIVRHAAELSSVAFPDDRLTLSIQLGEKLPRVLASELELEQMLMNLIRNGIEASHDHAQIAIATQAIPAGVRILVRDHGSGIPPEHLSRIFDPFFSTRQHNGGTGLGLSICHQIVNEHGGTISAMSAPGGGSMFQVDLPEFHPTSKPGPARRRKTRQGRPFGNAKPD